MKAYGYVDKYDSDLLELQEVSIAVNVDELRRIVEFLSTVADLMEKHGDEFGHEHLCDFVNRRGEKFEGPDIVVCRSFDDANRVDDELN